MSPRRKSDLLPIGPVLPRLLDDLGVGGGARVLRIAERWAEAVGPDVARRSRPLALRGEELLVGVESSVWCQQLQLQIPALLDALRTALGDEAPARLRLRVAADPGLG